MRTFFLIPFILALFLAACNNNETDEKVLSIDSNQTDSLIEKEPERRKINTSDYEYNKDEVTLVADTIRYTAMVRNPNKEDEYMDEWLKDLDLKAFADLIFKAVYEERTKAYNYSTNEVMTIDDIKQLEKEYKRDRIGKIFFMEEWYFDEKKIQMFKKVNSIMLAYERLDENDKNLVVGYKAGIRIYLNDIKLEE